MIIKKFNKENDYEIVIQFLTDCYEENKNMVCWLPERFDDLIFRIDTLYHDERGLEKSSDYTYIFEENNEIVGLIVPDGDSFNSCIKNGFEKIFSEMIELSEKELLPLFEKDKDGKVDFLVISHDSLKYQADELLKRGYKKNEAEDYDNVQHPLEKNYQINLPKGYKQVYGEELDDNMKAKAVTMDFIQQMMMEY